MKEYFIKCKIKTYKFTEDGKIHVKRNAKPNDLFTELKHTHNQIVIGNNTYKNKKIFFYELYHNCKVKKNENVIFKIESQNYSKDNLILVRRKKSDPKYFQKSNNKILHYDVKNNLLNIYDSQSDCKRKLGIFQTEISKCLIRGKRRVDGSYFIYDNDKLKKIPKNVSLRESRRECLNIVQLDLNGKIINKFDNIKRAIDFLGLDEGCTSHIVKCCKLKRNSAYGYKWRYTSTLNRRLKKWICYYEGNILKYVTQSRKEMCEKLNITKFHISNIISEKYTPKTYNITEVGYEVGFNLKKKLETQLAA